MAHNKLLLDIVLSAGLIFPAIGWADNASHCQFKVTGDINLVIKGAPDSTSGGFLHPFQVNCNDGPGATAGVVFLTTVGQLKSVEPGKYKIIANDKLDAKGAPGDFVAQPLSLPVDGKMMLFAVSEPGSIEVTKVDTTAIEGTFSFKAVTASLMPIPGQVTRHVLIEGRFSFPCKFGVVCQ
jgi:hypothetical protein